MGFILEVKDLEKWYGKINVIKGIRFGIKEGDIVGFIGPNGAGKSTTIKMITDIEKRSKGEIKYNGQRLEEHIKEFKSILGVVPQDIAVYEDLTAYQNVRFFCALYHIKGRELEEKTQKALEFVGLWDRRGELPGKYSGGMKRRLNIACAIAHEPKLLIMDEPTVGIDPQSRNHIMECIKELAARGTTVIYVSHYMEEIEIICNRIIMMDNGLIIEDMDKEGLKAKYAADGMISLETIFLQVTGTSLRDEEN